MKAIRLCCQHSQIVLFLQFLGHLNLSSELRIHDLRDAFRTFGIQGFNIHPGAAGIQIRRRPNLALILPGRSLPTSLCLVEDESSP